QTRCRRNPPSARRRSRGFRCSRSCRCWSWEAWAAPFVDVQNIRVERRGSRGQRCVISYRAGTNPRAGRHRGGLVSRIRFALLSGDSMFHRSFFAAGILAASALPVLAQTTSATRLPERAVRRDIPMTNAIRRAFAAGTRDSTGRPGRNYAQLRTDYTINARLDPESSRISGRETIVLQNNTADSLASIVMRLDMNHFLFGVPRAVPWVPAEETDGFVITKLTVNGQPVNLAPAGFGRGGGRGGQPQRPTENFATGIRTTRATISLV